MAEGAVSAAEDKTDTTAKTDTQDKKGSNAVETENMAVEHGDSVAQTDRCLRRRRRRCLHMANQLSQPAEVGLAIAVHHAEHLRHMLRRDVDWAFQVRQPRLVLVRRRRNLDLPCAVPRASRPAASASSKKTGKPTVRYRSLCSHLPRDLFAPGHHDGITDTVFEKVTMDVSRRVCVAHSRRCILAGRGASRPCWRRWTLVAGVR